MKVLSNFDNFQNSMLSNFKRRKIWRPKLFEYLENRVNAKERFHLINEFLKKYYLLWQPPLLACYPEPLKHLPKEWVQYVKNTSEENLFRISNYKCTGKALPIDVPKDLNLILNEIRDLIDFPFYHHDQNLLETDPIYKQQINRLNLKKSHELRNLGPLIKDFSDDINAKQLVEIGGGKGFLSLAASACRADHIVIDLAEDLLGKCQSYFDRWARKKNLKCIVKKIDSANFQLDCGIPQDSLMAGLHLCGNLSIYFLNSVVNHQNFGVVSLGCCYHRLEDGDQNLSGLGEFHLGASEYRLALAPYHYKCIETYRNNVIKNIYRYGLFCIFHKVNGLIPKMGELNDFEYPRDATDIDFETFLKLNSAKFLLPISLSEALQMFQEEFIQMAKDMETYEFIRRMFSRVIESYLILDRLLFLEQKGMQGNIVQLFDGRISPRNLGIIAKY